MFSRLKKAGQKVKSLAASTTGSGRSVFNLWRPDASKRVGANSGSQHNNKDSGSSRLAHQSSNGEGAAAGMLLPGQAAAEGVTVITASSSGHASHGHSRRRSANDPGQQGSRRSTQETQSDRRMTGESGSGSQHHSHHHHHSKHHHQHHQHRRGTGEHDRRGTSEHGSRSPSPPPTQQPGPVAESVAAQQDYIGNNDHASSSSGSGSWGAGLRIRRLRAGMQQQYACAKLQPELMLQQQRGMMALGCGSGSSFSSNSFSQQAAAEAAFRRQSSGSSSSANGSGSSSFTLKQEAAAAFAAAAAADALRPCHVIPELLDDTPGFEALRLSPAVSTAAALSGLSSRQSSGQPHWLLSQALGGLTTMQQQQQQHGGSSSRQLSMTAVGRQGEEDEDESFTWQEFLATVAAINYPNVHRQQQQQQQLQRHQDQQQQPSAAASLGPIAEGLESAADAAVVDQAASAPSPYKSSPRAARTASGVDLQRLSFSSADCAAGQVTARTLRVSSNSGAAAAPHHQQHQQQPSPAAVPHAGGGDSRSKSPVQLQQLVLDDIDRQLTNLGLQPLGGAACSADEADQPSTPCLMFSAGNSPAANDITGGVPRSSKARASPELQPAARAATPPPPVSAATAAGATSQVDSPSAAEPAAAVDSPTSSSAAASPSVPEGKPAKDPARRVTLFTESMRHRGECPAPPRSPRFDEGRRPNSRGARGLLGAAAAAGAAGVAPPTTSAQLDEWLNLNSTQSAASGDGNSARAGDRAGGSSGRRVSAIDSAANIAQLVLASGSVEPGVTAQAIRRRKSAAVSHRRGRVVLAVFFGWQAPLHVGGGGMFTIAHSVA